MLALAPWLAAACAPPETAEVEVVSEVDAWTPENVEIVGVVGSGTLEVPIRLVNGYRAAVPGGAVTVALDASAAAVAEPTVDADGTGYAVVEVDAPLAERVALEVTATEDGVGAGATGEAWAVLGELPPLEMAPLAPLSGMEVERVALGTGGVAVASGPEVWWVPAEPGQPPHRVARMEAPIEGMWAAHVDRDGVLDLVLWTERTVALLRGRWGGGYAWGGGWTGIDGTIAGASVGDVDSDLDGDLAIAVSEADGGTGVALLLGDGAWGFEPAPGLFIEHTVDGIAAGDEDGDGAPDVSVLDLSSQSVRRYRLGDAGWAAGSPPELAGYTVAEGSDLAPPVDLDGDGTPELVVVGAPGSSQDLVFFRVEEQVRYEQSFGAYHLALSDVNGDGATDILAFEENALHVIRYSAADAGFVIQDVPDAGAAGPIAADDLDGDGTADLAVAGSAGVRVLAGSVGDSGSWTRLRHGWTSVAVSLDGPVAALDIDGDGADEVFGFFGDGSGLWLGAWRWDADAGQLGRVEALQVGSGAGEMAGLGLVSCGGRLFGLAETAGTVRLYRFGFDGGGLAVERSVAVDASLLACRATDGGRVFVGAASAAGAGSLYNADLAQVATADLGAVEDVAVLATSPTTAELVGCGEPGCSVAGVDLDGDGADERVDGGASVSVVLPDGTTEELDAPGDLALADADGDGRADLVAFDAEGGRFTVMRAVDGGLAPPAAWLPERDGAASAVLADLDGDGLAELVVGTDDGRIVTSAPSAR